VTSPTFSGHLIGSLGLGEPIKNELPVTPLVKKKGLAPGDPLPVTPRKLQVKFNLSENVFIVKSNCVGDFQQDEEGGYMREMNFFDIKNLEGSYTIIIIIKALILNNF
jgi:hypothetical protein